MNIILLSHNELSRKNTVILADERHLHVRDVLRGKTGDTVQCGVVGLSKGEGEILVTGRHKTEIRYTETGPADSPLPLSLIVGLVRPIQARRILKAAAAYGIGRVLWVPTELGEKSYAKAGLWQQEAHLPFLLEGASQGGHVRLPEVKVCSSLEDGISAAGKNGYRLLFHPDTDATGFHDFYSTYRNDAAAEKPPICAAIGSERGWTERERGLFISEGFVSYRLGPSILRTEDAVHGVLSLLSFVCGEMD